MDHGYQVFFLCVCVFWCVNGVITTTTTHFIVQKDAILKNYRTKSSSNNMSKNPPYLRVYVLYHYVPFPISTRTPTLEVVANHC